MNAPLSRPHAAFQAAVSRLHQAVRQAATRAADSLGLAALSGGAAAARDVLVAAQFDLNRNLAAFELAFAEKLHAAIQREVDTQPTSQRGTAGLQWDALRLVDDDEVEAQVSADRLAQAVRHACEWELRELDAYVGALLRLPSPEPQRNPLRPELVGKAVMDAMPPVSERAEVRHAAAAEIGRSLVSAMPGVYAEIVGLLRDSGLQPLGMAVRPGHTAGGARSTSGAGPNSHPSALDAATGAAPLRGAAGTTGQGVAGGRDTATSGRGGFASSGGGASPSPRGGAPIGHVDAQMMSLIRRLAQVSLPADTDLGAPPASNWARGGAPVAPNLIHAHRDELRRASTGTLDHMVIDVVGSLFDQILSDPKVPPQMARQIARLQLPVLRVALGDSTFFSSRRHPVRRFVNRLASLAVAFDDLAEGAGQQFMRRVRDLVQQIVEGDFDQMAVYERQLAELEAFNAEQVQREVQEQAPDAVKLLEDKEHGLLLHQRYMQRLQAELAPVAMPEFLRTFVTQVWSQAIVHAVRRDGETGALAQRLRRSGRDLVMSLQPKGTPAERKAFLMALPPLMKDLNEALAMIGWPEQAKKDFFARLMPLHAEALKSGSISQLDYNLMAKRLDAILGAPLPGAADRPPPGALPVLDDVVAEQNFSAEEAQRIGLVAETAVDWNGQVDIDLSAEPEVSADDVRLEGLPAPDAVEPTSGAALAANVQLGYAYRMHLEDGWHKVRLTYISPGRAFFVFTRGQKHQRTISMTARMLARLCEAGRLRAYENAYLLERATARARRQLAALKDRALGARR
ncbi:MAG: DUF1631 domain-containing protein [Burkholderiaceae bacterium]|jgi:hypothetical protein|nr:DUF1631 domain-containing protein [Burkholderiaceae bacterium]